MDYFDRLQSKIDRIDHRERAKETGGDAPAKAERHNVMPTVSVMPDEAWARLPMQVRADLYSLLHACVEDYAKPFPTHGPLQRMQVMLREAADALKGKSTTLVFRRPNKYSVDVKGWPTPQERQGKAGISFGPMPGEQTNESNSGTVSWSRMTLMDKFGKTLATIDDPHLVIGGGVNGTGKSITEWDEAELKKQGIDDLPF